MARKKKSKDDVNETSPLDTSSPKSTQSSTQRSAMTTTKSKKAESTAVLPNRLPVRKAGPPSKPKRSSRPPVLAGTKIARKPAIARPPVDPPDPPPKVPPKKRITLPKERIAPSKHHRMFTPEEQRIKNSQATNERQKAKLRIAQDIAPLPLEDIDWERRLECKESLKKFAETYMAPVFYFGWSSDQLKCVTRVEEVMRVGGMFTLAMPRGGGKTAICRAGLLWATAYGFRRFMYFIGSTDEKSRQSLEFIKTYWWRNKMLQQDFPEVGHAIDRLENNWHKARGQLFEGLPTHIVWGSGDLRLPCLTLPVDVADWYAEHDPDSVSPVPCMDYDHPFLDDRPPDQCVISPKEVKGPRIWVPRQAGIMVSTSGIDGSIRGEALVHPVTLEQPRPDLVLLDDIQKEQKADSPILCEKLARLVDGAVQGLAGPGRSIAALMPCTVIREGDVADQYLNPLLKPEWQGERCAMVVTWPAGITDVEITNDTEEGKLWNQYAELYRLSLREHHDIRLAQNLYLANREVMDRGFVCSWPDRYDRDGKLPEVSAQQHAMNLRLKLGPTFLSEYQNKGRKLQAEGEITITAAQLEKKTIACKEFEVPNDTQKIVAHIDVQMEIMFYTVFASNMDFTGIFPTYGTWPDTGLRYFTKDQTRSWSMLTTEFFKVYPEHRNKAIKTTEGHIRAPLDAKIYFGLRQTVNKLKGMTFIRQDQFKTPMIIDKITIDTRWGETSEVVKRFIKESGDPSLLAYYGQYMPPTHRQFEEYDLKKGWLFEHQVSPHVQEPKWCIKPNPDGQFYMMADVDRLKDFLFARLASPLGTSGSIALYDAPAEKHELFAHHVCNAEYPEPVTARGRTKNKWTVREGVVYDNDFLDCACGNMALMSTFGVSVKTTDRVIKPVIRKLSETYSNRRRQA